MAEVTSGTNLTVVVLDLAEAEAVTAAVDYLLAFDSIGANIDMDVLRRVQDALSE
jgi:hypothetical protein